MVSKMMGCRVPDKLDEVIRKRANKENRSVNDVMVELLKNGFKDFPEKEEVNMEVNITDTTDIIQKIKKLKLEIKQLEEDNPGGYFSSRDKDIQACIDALKIKVKQLIGNLPFKSVNKDEDDEDDDEYWS